MPNTDTSDCVKTILGRPVPLIIIHALVSLRGAIKSVKNRMFRRKERLFQASIEDWREIALELDIIQPWPTPFGGKTFAMQMIDGVKPFTREEYANLLGHVVRELSQYYSYVSLPSTLSYFRVKALPAAVQDDNAEPNRDD